MSCQKILNRVVTPEDVNYRRDSINAVASDLHEYTFGITSDPLTQLAIMIATLAHDVDHTGMLGEVIELECLCVFYADMHRFATFRSAESTAKQRRTRVSHKVSRSQHCRAEQY